MGSRSQNNAGIGNSEGEADGPAPRAEGALDRQPAKACQALNRVWIVAYNTQALVGAAYQPRCGQWSCPYCADLNRDEWAYVGTFGALNLPSHAPQLQFVTITSRGYVSAVQSIAIFKTAWPKLIRRIAYRQDSKPEYLLIPEHHKSGKLHAHFLITSVYHSQHWWHDQAFLTGLGYQAKAKPVRDPVEAGHYVTKELTKQLTGRPWPRSFRRVRHSQGWPMPPQKENTPDWEFEVAQNEGQKNWIVALLRDEGYTIKAD